MSLLARIVSLWLLLVIVAGCGSGDSATVPAEGVIKINGTPAGNLLIQFNPTQETGGKIMAATALSEASGRFVLKSDNGRDGVVLGTHKVTVIDNNLSTEDEPTPGKRPMVRNRVPSLYRNVATTPLEVVVQAGKKDYDLNVIGLGK